MTQPEPENTIRRTSPQVVVIGGINVDFIVETDDPLIRGSSNPGVIDIFAGGVARNIAELLARLGVSVDLAGQVGDDPLSRWVLAQTADAGVDVSGVRQGDGKVGFYITIQEDGDLATAVSDLSATERLTPEEVLTVLARYEPGEEGRLPCILVLDCNLRPAVLEAAVLWANRWNVLVVVEPVSVAKVLRLTGLEGVVDVVTPNEMEDRALMAALESGGGPVPEIPYRVVTCGESGAMLKVSGSSLPAGTYPGTPVRPINTNGAGDAFVGGLVWALVQDLDNDGMKKDRPPVELLSTGIWDRAFTAAMAAGRITVESRETVPTGITTDQIEKGKYETEQ